MGKLCARGRYGVVPVAILNDPNLSAKAKGLWAYLQSKPEDWFLVIKLIAADFKDDETSIESGLLELEQAGYLERTAILNRQGEIICYCFRLLEK